MPRSRPGLALAGFVIVLLAVGLVLIERSSVPALAQSESAVASMNQSKALFLANADLPVDGRVVGREFTFFYDNVAAGWHCITGTILGMNFMPGEEIQLFVSVPTFQHAPLRCLRYRPEWGSKPPHWIAVIDQSPDIGLSAVPGQFVLGPFLTATGSR